MPKLQSLFSEWEVKAIQAIHIPRTSCEDKWEWHYSKHGKFTVSSAYYVELDEKWKKRASTSTNVEHNVWKRLWDTSIPTKINLFGWRALHNGL